MNLTIIRGLPGAGKSTLAHKLAQATGAEHIEADQYFMHAGEYIYDGMKIGAAHEWCLHLATIWIEERKSVIVSNTFTKISELRPYFALASRFHLVPDVITLHANRGSIHGVPAAVVERMRTRFVYNLDPLYKEYE